MINFFKANNVISLLVLLLLLIAVTLPFFIDPMGITLSELKNFVLGEAISKGNIMYVEIYDNTPPLSALAFGIMSSIFGRSLSAWRGMALFIIFFQASYFAYLLVKVKAQKEHTYIPALVFGILCIFSFDMITFSSELLGTGMMIVVLKHLFHELAHSKRRNQGALTIGFYVGITSLFVFFYSIFLIASFLILLFFVGLNPRKTMLLLIGFLLPHIALMMFYFYLGSHALLWENFYLSNFMQVGSKPVIMEGILSLSSFAIAYLFLLLMFRVGQFISANKYQSDIIRIMLLWSFYALIYILFFTEVSPSKLILLVPPIAYFIAFEIVSIKRLWLAELVLWTLIVGMISIGLLARYGKIENVNYSLILPKPIPLNFKVKNKEILVLGNKPSLYTHNQLGGFFLNWDVSRPLFEDLASYDHIEKIAVCFKVAPPEVIIDEENLMPVLTDKIPVLERMYRRTGNIYILINREFF